MIQSFDYFLNLEPIVQNEQDLNQELEVLLLLL